MSTDSDRASEIKREVRSTFDFISDDYDKLRGLVWNDLIEFASSCLRLQEKRKDSTILDLACGNARHAIHIAQEYGLGGIGIDFSPELLNLAKKRIQASRLGHMVALVNADASNIPLRDSSIDATLFVAAVHHLPTVSERRKSMQEFHRTMAQSGRGIVTVWRRWQRRFAPYFMKQSLKRLGGYQDIKEFGDLQVAWRSGHGSASVMRFYHLFSRRELEKLITETGFEINRIVMSSKKAGEGSFFACIQKK